MVKVGFKQARIFPGLHEEKQTKRKQGCNGENSPNQRISNAFLSPFFSSNGQHIVNDEKYNRYQNRHSESAFLNDCAYWGTNHKHYQACNSLGIFLIPGDFPTSGLPFIVIQTGDVITEIIFQRPGSI